MDAFQLLKEDLKVDEGLSLFAYVDTVGKVTIGYGRNVSLGGRGLSKVEADYLLGNDVIEGMKDAAMLVSSWVTIDPVRQATLANLAMNMGSARLSKFVKFLAAVEVKDWKTAASELQDSKWFTQVGVRGPKHVARILTGTVV